MVDRVHIRFCGNGGWRFRPYGESLLSNARSAGPAKRNQKVSPQASGPSLRLGVPSLRYPSGDTALRSASRRPTCSVFDCVERRCAPLPG
ncbi:hypothetical protein OKW12_000460 [Pseudomonas silensiensis]|nr:hypothetical protein [Pseudomonas silensiensis]